MAKIVLTTWVIGKKSASEITDQTKVSVVFKLSHKDQRRIIRTGYEILPTQFEEGMVVNHDKAGTINAVLITKLAEYLGELASIAGIIDNLDIDQVRDKITTQEKKTVRGGGSGLNVFDSFKEYEEYLISKKKTGSARNYSLTRRTLEKWWGGSHLDFSSLTSAKLTEFHDSFDKGYDVEKYVGTGKSRKKVIVHKDYSLNTTSIHERNIRTIFNREIKARRISADLYPFEEFVILENENTEHRDLTIKRLWQIRDLDLSGETERVRESRDLFMLSFYLIGMNLIDFWHFDFAQLDEGSLHYVRKKTSRKYSFSIPPEAREILLKYRTHDDTNVFCERLQRFDSLTTLVRDGLIVVAEKLGLKSLTWYHARHTWSTLAQNKADVSEDDARLALWPKKQRVADRYNNKDLKRIDVANRRTIDLLPKEKYNFSA
jgi:hypothetical protein